MTEDRVPREWAKDVVRSVPAVHIHDTDAVPTFKRRVDACIDRAAVLIALEHADPPAQPAPPLDVDAFIAGLDSPNHSPESRRAWISLFYRDLRREAGDD